MSLSRRFSNFKQKREIKRRLQFRKLVKDLQTTMILIDEDPATVVDPVVQTEIDKQVADETNILI